MLGAIAALYAVVLLAPPLISTDIFSYQAYSRMGAVYGVSPYLNGPHGIAQDPLFQYVGAKWAYIPSVYGPVFTTLSYVLSPLSIVASVVAYKLIAAVSALAIVAMVWNLARRRGVDPVRAVGAGRPEPVARPLRGRRWPQRSADARAGGRGGLRDRARARAPQRRPRHRRDRDQADRRPDRSPSRSPPAVRCATGAAGASC